MNHTGTATAHESGDYPGQPQNGNGILSKISKGSWIVIILISAITASVTGFFSMRESITVGFATTDQKFTEHDGRLRNIEETIKSMVPASVHAEREKRNEAQAEFVKFRLDKLEKEVENLRDQRRP